MVNCLADTADTSQAKHVYCLLLLIVQRVFFRYNCSVLFEFLENISLSRQAYRLALRCMHIVNIVFNIFVNTTIQICARVVRMPYILQFFGQRPEMGRRRRRRRRNDYGSPFQIPLMTCNNVKVRGFVLSSVVSLLKVHIIASQPNPKHLSNTNYFSVGHSSSVCSVCGVCLSCMRTHACISHSYAISNRTAERERVRVESTCNALDTHGSSLTHKDSSPECICN